MRGSNKLSATRVAKASKPGRYGDGANLWLQVSKWKGRTSRSWLFQFTSPVSGKTRQFGLGPLDICSLAEAREQTHELRKLVRQGIDPIEQRKVKRLQRRIEDAKRTTFQQSAEKFIAAQEEAWRSPVHRHQWRATLATYAYPIIGSLPVGDIDTALVLKVLEPIWHSKPETATRLRGRIEKILHSATAHGHRQGDNPARWKGHLDHLLAAPGKIRKTRHHPALPYKDIPAFMAELRQRDGISARALEVTILTALRTSEVIGATWSEIDLAAKTWTIPAARMKMQREHRLPLCNRLIEILGSLPREEGSDFVFIGGRQGAPLSNMAMLELIKGMRPGLTVHGFRSTFKDWAADTTAYPNMVTEMALAHGIGNAVEASYRRSDLFEKRRRLMAEWARYCTQKPVMETSKVTQLRKV